jgi:hypothetical protein
MLYFILMILLLDAKKISNCVTSVNDTSEEFLSGINIASETCLANVNDTNEACLSCTKGAGEAWLIPDIDCSIQNPKMKV